ncbi:MAG: TolC family protein [Planctomycetes bacterium]|nr:TolC family protein [Planctomycetota bacterium]
MQSGGCTRPFYRKEADKEVSEILAQKNKYPAWAIENWHVYADPRARYADSSNPDHPPKPPDDPAAYDLSPNPQKPGKAGVARIEGTGYLELIAQWDRENRERAAQEEAEEKQQAALEKARQEAATGQETAGTRHRVPFRVVPLPDPPPPPVSQQPSPPAPQAAASLGVKQVAYQEPATRPPANGSMGTAPPQGDAIVEAKSRSALDITGRPTYMLTLDQAAELAMFNSREYQDQRETLYLAALPVTLQRFSFMAQYFAVQQAIRSYTGRNTLGGQSNSWALNSGTGLSKLLPTGALLLLNCSNQTVFEFLNPKRTTSVSTLDFRAIQPLLRDGGKAVALEPLTQAERSLLYQIRTFARFRKELYVAVAAASGGSISGGAFQPTGVLAGGGGGGAGVGASGLVPGVIPAVATTIASPIFPAGTAGALSLAGGISSPPSGYLNTMLEKIQVYIDQENIDVLSNILQRYRGLLEGDVVNPLQLQSVEQALVRGRTTLLTDQQQYLQAVDSFKRTLGVPMPLSIELDDSVLRPLMKQFRRARAIIDNEQAAVSEASALLPLEKAPRLRAELLRLFQNAVLVRGTPFARRIRARWAEWEKLSDAALKTRLDDLKKQVQQLLDRQAALQRAGQNLSPAEEVRLTEANAQIDLGNFERALRLYETNYVDKGKPKKPADALGERQRVSRFQSVISWWQKVLVEARNEQWAVVRSTWPKLPRACVDGVDLVNDDLERALAAGAQHALANRLDLMNVRSQLVDAWRQVAVFANALLGTFNVEYRLTSNSPLGVAQPLNIGGSGNAHRLTLNTQFPLTRILERNNYRASLIAYQRQRRTLQQAEDIAVQVVNGELYQLRQLAEAYRLQQRQLELAYLTIENSLESIEAPTAPGRGALEGPAALTQQLLSSQGSLPQAQNALLTLWIQYLNARLELYRDLELMSLDARGVWIDEIRDCDCGLVEKEPSEPASRPAPAEEIVPKPRPLPPS